MIARHILRAIHQMELMAAISIIWTANVDCQSIHPPIGTPLPDPPQVVTSFELQAINDPATGEGAFPEAALECTRCDGTSVGHWIRGNNPA
jgi:hypothetical protein